MRRSLIASVIVLALAVAGGVLSAGPATADEPTVIACSATALAEAFATGGTYVYGANCELMLGTELTLHTATTLTLESGDHHVSFVGTDIGSPFWAGNGNRFATVDGHLTLEGIDVRRFSVGGTTLDGTPGTAGTNGLNNSCPVCPTGGNGAERGSNGTGGGHGGDGRDGHGGALLIDGTGVVTLEVSEISEDYADGGRGGAGGAGGQGGDTVDRSAGNENTHEPGGDGGDGGEGGRGGDSYGGAIENDGTLFVNLSKFEEDIAMGGTSVGGAGGEGGLVDGAGMGGPGGSGGAAGRTGSAYGGAIYNTGTLTLANTEFDNDYAGYTAPSFSGSGGEGGASHVQGGPGGNGAAPGPVGVVSGGDVYSTGAFTVSGGQAHGVTFAAKSSGGGGGRGGAGCGYEGAPNPSCQTNGVNGSPTPGAPPPVVSGQTGGETFVPTPNSGPGGGDPAPGGGGGTAPGGGSGSGEAGSGGSGSGGSGSSGSGGSGSSSGTSGAGSGGSNNGGSGNDHANVGGFKSSGGTVSAPVECPASGSSCTITGELTAAGNGSGGKSPDAIELDPQAGKPAVLGRATTEIPPGRSKVLKVALGASGRRLLAKRHRLAARLTIFQTIGPQRTDLRSAKVDLR